MHWSKMSRNVLKLPTILEFCFKCTGLKWVEMHLICPPWVGEQFEICCYQMARNTLKLSV